MSGDAAWLVPPLDAAALADALRAALAESPAARAARIARGLRHAAAFTWGEAAERLITAVRGLLEAR